MIANPTQRHDDDQHLAGDLLIGATRIAEFISALIGEPVEPEDVYYYRRSQKWPIGKLGAELIASKQRLNKHGQKITAG